MGKNKSKHRVRTDYAVRVAALRKVDNELTKEHRTKGSSEHGKRKSDTADND